MAHTLSAHYDTPHGVACAMLLPISMEFNRDYTGERYRAIAKAMGVEGTETMSQEEYRDAAIAAVRKLSKDVGIPEKNERIKEEDLEQLAKDVLAQNEKSVTDYKNGKTNALGYLVGQCMKASKGKANPGIVKEIVTKMLNA